MDSWIRALLARNDGIVTREQLLYEGLDPRRLARLVRTGQLVAVRRGVYTTGELWASWDEYAAKPLARVRAAHLTLWLAHVKSHDSAALLHRMRLIRPQDSQVHVTNSRTRASERRAGIHIHGAAFDSDDVTTVQGMQTLGPARTAADLARQHGYRAGLVAADGLLDAGVERSALWDVAERMLGWPEVTTVRRVVADADGGAESAAETLGRELVLEAGLGPVETQFPVPLTGGSAWCDIRVHRHFVEVDGDVKYRTGPDGLVPEGSTPFEVVKAERARQREIQDLGCGVSRLGWSDFWGSARDRAIRRLRQEYAVTEQRYGRELPAHLAEYAARMRGLRRRPA